MPGCVRHGTGCFRLQGYAARGLLERLADTDFERAVGDGVVRKSCGTILRSVSRKADGRDACLMCQSASLSSSNSGC